MRRRRRATLVVLCALVVGSLLVLFLSRRAGPRPSRAVAARAPAGGAVQVDDPPDAAAIDAGVSARAIVEDARRYAVRTWSFALERYALKLENAGMTTALDAVLARTGAELVVNGGFFDPDGKPVGLAMSEGAVLSRLAKTLSGGVLTSDGAQASLSPVEGFVLPDGGTFALQCRPRLVVDRVANVKSDDGKRAERTALCTRDDGRTVDVVIVRGSEDGESAGPSLFALARHLVEVGCEAALNLDGGPSTGVAWREDGGVKLLAPRGPVRLVLTFDERP